MRQFFIHQTAGTLQNPAFNGTEDLKTGVQRFLWQLSKSLLLRGLEKLKGGGSTVWSLHYDLMYLGLFSQAEVCVLFLSEYIYGTHQVY